MSDMEWGLAPEIISRGELKQSSLQARKDGFPSYVPIIHTYDSKEVPVNANTLSSMRANPEDRRNEHNISLLT